ncbi:bifunctional DNA-formamidopyrimidine glycosylase/DNA-(apurinic or apyrimidinic site) lyase [Methylibium petroleiphilum]|uniref:Formamidopyrimidine-DNA glycosylase n=1 Tax=Methylibium petroleiphilum (strain ATCC BAA-1232 / LMG 22953 / PM1) TaxID=420662 RepID=A2SKU7_METPP|nr:bifunctional DNA-formamidopyrimidine glycosylase/DNA-(apurinic or apyrimidinic site) lyase [Methylibium petroleiphilum]ABM96186.1 Formamidopyrimidine-DNA glycosylase / DNA-(apurinic or apyrimidinic site) lyase [Methylibium petroleiphilum PM1]
MPELPEVEVTRLSLVDRLRGAEIAGVRVGKPLRWPLGCAPSTLVGRRLLDVNRRGKYLWFALGARPGVAADDGGLLLHLGMSGSLNLSTHAEPPGPWDHFDLATSHGLLRLTDPRRFGAAVWSSSRDEGAAGKLLAGLGVEPLEAGFTAALLHARLRGRRVAVKQALLAGDIVVGVGNIYASEALFLAGIDPRTPGHRISLARCERLVDAVRAVLARAVAVGGSTLRDFRDAHGLGGAFQNEARVYGREGEPCTTCGGTVRRIVQGQRSTYFCPHCQRR